jgi:hypothetical protein
MNDANKKFRIELRWRKTRWSKLVIQCNCTQNHRTLIFLGKTKFTIVWDCSNLIEFSAPQHIVLLSIWLSLLQCGVNQYSNIKCSRIESPWSLKLWQIGRRKNAWETILLRLLSECKTMIVLLNRLWVNHWLLARLDY